MRIRKTAASAPLSGVSLSNIYGNSNSNGYTQEYINSLDTYSSTETICGTWIDGRPIYRKVFTGLDGLPSSASQKSWGSTVTGLNNVDNVINIYGFASNGIWLNAIRPNGVTNCIGLWYDFDNQSIKVEVGINRSSLTLTVIMEYTKSSDLSL